MSLLSLFKRKTGKSAFTRAIKLYAVSSHSHSRSIDRPRLVDGLIKLCEKYFGEPPKEFDIHGPYGISKGATVGIKSFRNKLAKRGHEDYHALMGKKRIPGDTQWNRDLFAFHCLFCAPGSDAQFAELVISYSPETYKIDVTGFVKDLLEVFPADYGFATDFPDNYYILTESKIKKTFFGESISFDPAYSSWTRNIESVLHGKIRDLYAYNFLNADQAREMESIGLPRPVELSHGMSVLSFTDQQAYDHYKSVYEAKVKITGTDDRDA